MQNYFLPYQSTIVCAKIIDDNDLKYATKKIGKSAQVASCQSCLLSILRHQLQRNEPYQ